MTSAPSSTSIPLDVQWGDVALDEVMEGEFWAWQKTLPRHDPAHRNGAGRAYAQFPHPLSDGGLPSGWQVRWHTHYPAHPSDSLAIVTDVVVIERATGGWGLCTHTVSNGGFSLTDACPEAAYTVPQLYEQLLVAPAAEERLLARDLRAFALSLYDLSDPVEEAEATLVGLGGPLTVYPRALTR